MLVLDIHTKIWSRSSRMVDVYLAVQLRVLMQSGQGRMGLSLKSLDHRLASRCWLFHKAVTLPSGDIPRRLGRGRDKGVVVTKVWLQGSGGGGGRQWCWQRALTDPAGGSAGAAFRCQGGWRSSACAWLAPLPSSITMSTVSRTREVTRVISNREPTAASAGQRRLCAVAVGVLGREVRLRSNLVMKIIDNGNFFVLKHWSKVGMGINLLWLNVGKVHFTGQEIPVGRPCHSLFHLQEPMTLIMIRILTTANNQDVSPLAVPCQRWFDRCPSLRQLSPVSTSSSPPGLAPFYSSGTCGWSPTMSELISLIVDIF